MAWGTAFAENANTVLADGTETETTAEAATAQAGLANFGGEAGTAFLQGPLRNGFGGSDTSSRLQAGAGWSGARELSGNLWEQTIRLDADFGHWHGNGYLTAAALPAEADWPTAEASIYRGGGWNSLVRNDTSYAFRDLAISDRFYNYLTTATARATTGGRLALSELLLSPLPEAVPATTAEAGMPFRNGSGSGFAAQQLALAALATPPTAAPLRIWPNPLQAGQQLHVNQSVQQVQVLNQAGQVLANIFVGAENLPPSTNIKRIENFPSLPAGIYLLKISTLNQIQYARLVVE